MLPDFYDDLLPPGLHACTWEEFSYHFGFDDKRKAMIERLKLMLDRAKTCAFRKAVIFGSFVTKHDPGDIDIIWLTAPNLDREALAAECKELLDSANSRERFKCDVFDCAENSEVLSLLIEGFGVDKRTQKPRGATILDLASL